MQDYVIGIDYGTDSCRAVVVGLEDGKEAGSSVFAYPRWAAGKYCNPGRNQFRQHPGDYLEALEQSVKEALEAAPRGVSARVKAIAIDTTGSTPCAVDRAGTPLALTAGFEENPNAMFVLWKDHTAVKEAEEINTTARTWGGTDFTKFEGGIYSSEWFWAKMLHVLREDRKVREAAFSWVEHCDWMPAVLTGNTDPLAMKRSRCAAGHKAMWHADFGGLPAQEFLTALDPLLEGIRERLYTDTYTSDVPAGTLCEEWAGKLGLPQETVVAVGAFDAHMGAVGGEITPYSLLKVMGTSTCDMLIAPMEEVGNTLVRGICGQVDGSVVPGMLGMEAGQSAFGDIYAWFKEVVAWPLRLIAETGVTDADTAAEIAEAVEKRIISELSAAAEKIEPDESGILAVDWMNGRRTPDADQSLKGAITGLTLGSDAPGIFRALVEATAFGARAIAERFVQEGIPINDVIGIGGVAKKSPLVMQITADVMNKKIKVAASEQTVALGAAMFAAVAAGVFKDIPAAQKAIGSRFEAEYRPNPRNAAIYDKLYRKYLQAGTFIEKHIKSTSEGNP